MRSRRRRLIAQGLGSSPGHAHGAAMLDSDRAGQRCRGRQGHRHPVAPDHEPKGYTCGMLSANGIVTATGGSPQPRRRRVPRIRQAVHCRLRGDRASTSRVEPSPSPAGPFARETHLPSMERLRQGGYAGCRVPSGQRRRRAALRPPARDLRTRSRRASAWIAPRKRSRSRGDFIEDVPAAGVWRCSTH